MRTLVALAVSLPTFLVGCSTIPAETSRENTAATIKVQQQTNEPIHRLIYASSGRELDLPSTTELAAAIAEDFPNRSKFGPLRDGTKKYSEISITSRGITESGLLYTNVGGVTATPATNIIQLEYTRGKRNTNSPSVFTTSAAAVTVQPDPSQPGAFLIFTSEVKERIGREMLLFPLSPLAPAHEIQDDIKEAIRKMAPQIKRSTSHRVEIDSTYSPAAIFANFQRAYGRPIRVYHDTDTRSGDFNVPFNGNEYSPMRVEISPHRTGSKVVVKYSIVSILQPGQNLVQQLKSDNIEENIRRVVNQ